MLRFSNAKINLGLHITEKRPDGFHNIETVFYPVNWSDVIEITSAEAFDFKTYGIDIPGDPNDNLCLKAMDILLQEHPISPVHVHLLKNIPIGAGLGGGSSNASFILTMLNELFELNLGVNKLKEYADLLGSDCAFFIENKPQFASGRGNHLQDIDLDLSGYQVALVYPNLHINTAWAYSQITPQQPEISLAEIIIKHPIKDWKNTLHNDFQAPIAKTHPILTELTELCYKHNAIYSAMSGSGSTVFGIFEPHVDLTDLRTIFQGKKYLYKTDKF